MKSEWFRVSPRICNTDNGCQVHLHGAQDDGEEGEEEDNRAVEARKVDLISVVRLNFLEGTKAKKDLGPEIHSSKSKFSILIAWRNFAVRDELKE